MRYLLFFTMLFTLQFSSQASSIYGGEITWKCLTNGNFVFQMNVYTDPAGIFSFTNKNIQVDGSSLPTTTSGVAINTIVMKPKTVAVSVSSNNIYIYESDPINLNGTPPVTGWSFSYNLGCCRINTLSNLTGSNNTLLKATMYPSPNGAVNSCFDSSPQFMEMPKEIFFSDTDYITQNMAVDFDGDSLVYLLDRPLSGSGSLTSKSSFKSGYSLNNYTGNGNSNGNRSYEIEHNTGNVAFSYISGSQNIFNRSVTIESYRSGSKIAEVSREMLFRVLNSTTPLNQPEMSTNLQFNQFGIHYDTIMAGNTLSLPISLIDTVNAGDTMTLVPFGSSFSSDFFTASNCNNPNDTSCATLSFAPTLNNNTYPSRYEFQGVTAMYLSLMWDPKCSHLNDQGASKTHYFTFGYEANASEPVFYRTFAITVTPNPLLCNTITSLESKKSAPNGVKLFPNPTNGYFKLVSTEELSNVRINIRNIKGQLVKTLKHSNYKSQEIEIPGSTGVYFVELVNVDGGRQNLKVIKH